MTDVKFIDPMTANEWVSNNEAVVVDVREPHEYEEVHIAGSQLIPLSSIAENDLSKIANGKKIIVHCKLGKRGKMACEILFEQNPDLELYNLEGGIVAWEDAGFKVVK